MLKYMFFFSKLMCNFYTWIRVQQLIIIRINENPPTGSWINFFICLKAVQHLHNHDLVHMDIKPDNIFFGEKYFV